MVPLISVKCKYSNVAYTFVDGPILMRVYLCVSGRLDSSGGEVCAVYEERRQDHQGD